MKKMVCIILCLSVFNLGVLLNPTFSSDAYAAPNILQSQEVFLAVAGIGALVGIIFLMKKMYANDYLMDYYANSAGIKNDGSNGFPFKFSIDLIDNSQFTRHYRAIEFINRGEQFETPTAAISIKW